MAGDNPTKARGASVWPGRPRISEENGAGGGQDCGHRAIGSTRSINVWRGSDRGDGCWLQQHVLRWATVCCRLAITSPAFASLPDNNDNNYLDLERKTIHSSHHSHELL